MFPIDPAGFSWSQASSGSILPSLTSSEKPNSIIISSVSHSATESTLAIHHSSSLSTGFSTKQTEPLRSSSHSPDLTPYTTLESQGVFYQTSTVYDSYFASTGSATSQSIAATDKSSAAIFPATSEWEELLKNVTSLKIAMGNSEANVLIKDIEHLAQRFRRLVEKEHLTEKSATTFIAILQKLGDLLNFIPEKHHEIVKVS